jgi:hypothetical protein
MTTSIAAKVAHVKRAAQTRDHCCHWTGCQVQVAPAFWGCRAHWFALPRSLRDRIWAAYRPGQENDQRPSREYVEVAREVREWIAQNAERLAR